MDKYDQFIKDISELGYITVPYDLIYELMHEPTTVDLVEGLRMILVHNDNVTREIEEKNNLMLDMIEKSQPLSLEQTSEPVITESKPVDSTHTYPQNNQATQIIESLKYFQSTQELTNNIRKLSQDGIALIKLHLFKELKQIKKNIRTKIIIDPLADITKEKQEYQRYKAFLDELIIEQEILIEEAVKHENNSDRRIIILPNGKNSTYLLEDIKKYPESYDEIYQTYENIISKRFLNSKSIKALKDVGEKLYEYKKTNGIRILFVKRGNDIFICSLFYKDKNKSTKITANYEEAIKRFTNYINSTQDISSPDFDIQQKEFIGMIYGEIEPSQTLTLKKGGE